MIHCVALDSEGRIVGKHVTTERHMLSADCVEVTEAQHQAITEADVGKTAPAELLAAREAARAAVKE